MQMALARWGAWFSRGWAWWWSVGLLLAGWLALHYLPTTDDNVRRVGMCYETLGMLLVLWEVAAATKKHGLQPPWRRLARYWRDIPLRPPAPAGLSGHVVLEGIEVHGRAGVIHASGGTLEERVAALENKLKGVQASVDCLDDRIGVEERTRASADKTEAAARAQADDQIRDAIKGLEVGGIDLTLFGLLWLFVGMVMTTGTPELCMVLDCIPQEAAPVQKDEARTIRVPAWPSVRT
ncbi:hypothetical protein [Azohydromonas caseinilytica]|uniref:Uncharacterized protein n=1 Tax=Azohydromonas caseinilytica TaxID=2728836 RepID=A0A848F9S3_9BURK|nr:hypothetical protein [Azohydromonas caseinilytica]NML15596.1 hypothetical protein [Azohydromonas caseinilytica]